MTDEELKQLDDRARSRNEPLYVTPAEFAEIRRLEIERQVERDRNGVGGWRLPDDPLARLFLGTPVVVDADKAAEQRATGGKP